MGGGRNPRTLGGVLSHEIQTSEVLEQEVHQGRAQMSQGSLGGRRSSILDSHLEKRHEANLREIYQRRLKPERGSSKGIPLRKGKTIRRGELRQGIFALEKRLESNRGKPPEEIGSRGRGKIVGLRKKAHRV